jgi:hypothetical protein
LVYKGEWKKSKVCCFGLLISPFIKKAWGFTHLFLVHLRSFRGTVKDICFCQMATNISKYERIVRRYVSVACEKRMLPVLSCCTLQLSCWFPVSPAVTLNYIKG